MRRIAAIIFVFGLASYGTTEAKSVFGEQSYLELNNFQISSERAELKCPFSDETVITAGCILKVSVDGYEEVWPSGRRQKISGKRKFEVYARGDLCASKGKSKNIAFLTRRNCALVAADHRRIVCSESKPAKVLNIDSLTDEEIGCSAEIHYVFLPTRPASFTKSN